MLIDTYTVNNVPFLCRFIILRLFLFPSLIQTESEYFHLNYFNKKINSKKQIKPPQMTTKTLQVFPGT